jgi:hypothetical protein
MRLLPAVTQQVNAVRSPVTNEVLREDGSSVRARVGSHSSRGWFSVSGGDGRGFSRGTRRVSRC